MRGEPAVRRWRKNRQNRGRDIAGDRVYRVMCAWGTLMVSLMDELSLSSGD